MAFAGTFALQSDGREIVLSLQQEVSIAGAVKSSRKAGALYEL